MYERLYKRGAIWWCWYYDAQGRRVRRSTRCRDQRAAEAVLKRFERSAQSATDPTTDLPDTVAEAVGHLEVTADVSDGTRHMLGVKGAQLARLLGTIPLSGLTLDDVQGFCEVRSGKKPNPDGDTEKAARETVRKELGVLRQALALAKRRGRFAGDPASVLPEWTAARR